MGGSDGIQRVVAQRIPFRADGVAVALAYLWARPADAEVTRGEPRAGRALDFAYWEWGAETGPSVLLVHATGFHARCWDAVARRLSPSLRVVAVDLRGHGASTKRGPFGWEQFGADVAAFAAALDLRDAIGVGHSLGGHAITQAAGRQPRRFAKLLLVDPAIFAPGQTPARATAFPSVDEHPVARRRDAWQSAEQMFERFAERQPFRLWWPEVLMDYCRHGLVASKDGFQLACRPRVEAAIYMGGGACDITDTIAGLPHPVTVLRAMARERREGAINFSASLTWPGLAAAFRNGREVCLPDLTHFIPMQRPDVVVAHVHELAGIQAPGAESD